PATPSRRLSAMARWQAHGLPCAALPAAILGENSAPTLFLCLVAIAIMDRNSIIIIVIAVVVLLGLSPVVNHFFPPTYKKVPITNSVSSVTKTGSSGNNALA